jgi:phospholipid/cholesterol/gamma-HCH transport system permease protein
MSEQRIACPDRLNEDTGRDLFERVREEAQPANGPVVLDLGDTQSMDSRGAAWLVHIADWLKARDTDLRLENQHEGVAEFVELIEPGMEAGVAAKRRQSGLFEGFGEQFFSFVAEARQIGELMVEAVYWMLMAPFEGRGFRWGSFIEELNEMGARAVKINFMMNFLLGLTIAMMSAAQLRTVGLDIWVAGLVMVAFARELAVIMTSIVVSARTGAAITAEIANMQVQEEIDALRGMGLNVTQFLVAPKLLALVVVLPILTGIGMIAGIIGGAVWGHFVLGFRLSVWFSETLAWATLNDIGQGLVKSFFFANVIVLVGCHNGLRVKGGSRGVGLMTTRAVVMDIFFIVLIDMLFAVLFYYVLE